MRAAAADFVLALYNPVDKQLLREVLAVLRQIRGGNTPVGVVKDAYRQGRRVAVATLGGVHVDSADMRTTLIVGNSKTYLAQLPHNA
jgi:precorrin-3B C17-methyltransferase